jgi:hypothetical protein
MTARRGLGDIFQLATSATTTAQRINMRYATGVTYAIIGATSGNATLQEANAASGGTLQNIANGVTEYFTQNNGVWTRVTQAAAATVTCAAGGLLAVYFAAVNFSSGFYYIAATHASASFVYVLHGLEQRRDPPSFPDARA